MTVTRRIPRGIIRALVTASAGLCACGSQTPVTSDAHADAFVRAHNARREKVSLAPFRWSGELEHLARRRADRLAAGGCRFAHAPLPEDVGENLFRIEPDRREEGAPPVTATPEQVVDAWAAEEPDFDYDRNRCAQGKQCTHYTRSCGAGRGSWGAARPRVPPGGSCGSATTGRAGTSSGSGRIDARLSDFQTFRLRDWLRHRQILVHQAHHH